MLYRSPVSQVSWNMCRRLVSWYSRWPFLYYETTYAHIHAYACGAYTSFHLEDTHTFHTHAYVSRYLTRHYNIRTLLNDLFSFIEFA